MLALHASIGYMVCFWLCKQCFRVGLAGDEAWAYDRLEYKRGARACPRRKYVLQYCSERLKMNNAQASCENNMPIKTSHEIFEEALAKHGYVQALAGQKEFSASFVEAAQRACAALVSSCHRNALEPIKKSLFDAAIASADLKSLCLAYEIDKALGGKKAEPFIFLALGQCVHHWMKPRSQGNFASAAKARICVRSMAALAAAEVSFHEKYGATTLGGIVASFGDEQALLIAMGLAEARLPGSFPLVLALGESACAGHARCCEILADAGADVLDIGLPRASWGALGRAVKSQSMEAILVLLSKGADLYAPRFDQSRAIDCASPEFKTKLESLWLKIELAHAASPAAQSVRRSL